VSVATGRHRAPAGRPAGRRLPAIDDTPWAERVPRTLAGVLVVTWSFRLSGYLTFGPWLAVPVVLLGLTGLAALVVAWLPGPPAARRQRLMDAAVLAAVIAALALWTYFQLYTAPDYGTDEVAFDQYAAQLALHGINPYLHSMAAAFPLFHVSPNGYTFQLNGHPVTALSYPALAFEAYLPLLAAGVSTQAAIWVDVAAWAAAAVVLYAVLPRRLAPLAAVLLSLDVFTGYAVGGVTDFLYLPLLIGAAAGWDRFAWTRGPAAWRGPVLMGLAMAVKQTPWLIVPFVVAGIVLESRQLRGWAHGLRDGARYLAIALGAFLVPNLPYLVDAPQAWLHGILTPVTAPAVPAGQGLISLALSLPAGGGSLRAFNAAAVVVLVSLLACYLTAYPALKPAAFLLPSVVLFFAARSFGSYLVMLIPPAVTAAATIQRPAAIQRPAIQRPVATHRPEAPAGQPPPAAAIQRPLAPTCWRHWKWMAGGAAASCALATAAALLSPSPLALAVSSVHTAGQLATVNQVTVAVTNNSGRPVRPAFTVADGTTITAFWRRARGPAVLAAHQHASYTIQAPSYFAMPSINNGFQVLAFAQGPASLSRSPAFLPSIWRVVLRPATIGHPVGRGRLITVQAQLVDRLDAPVRAANVPVYLGQAIYAQSGTEFGQAKINRGHPGQTPIRARTDAAGVATFTIRSWFAPDDPVYFEANLVQPGSGYPYGYSPILAVRFRP
jgi:uncharacterized membrane protein